MQEDTSSASFSLLTRCRVVLVRTEVAANLGSTARIMCNFGLSDLVLVAPVADPADREARRLSTHGEDLLDSCRRVADLGTALADCVLVVGTTARIGGLYRTQTMAPADVLASHLLDAASSGPVALVFGPEPSGLTNDEITRCHWLLHIPTEPTTPALNLAQAVAIALYELRRAYLGQTRLANPVPEIAAFADQERMFDQLRDALERLHFLYGDKAETLMHGLRHLLGRARPTLAEVKLLLGLARQIRWFADHR
jgi:tRNA/rRNA methyltransferase